MLEKILHISASDTGGAGSAAFRVHSLFIQNGHYSKLLVLNNYKSDKNTIGIRKKNNIFYRAFYKLLEYLKNTNPLTLPTISKYLFLNKNETEIEFKTVELLKKITFSPDVIFIYWVSNFINAKNIRELNRVTGAPIFWLITDMAPLTGGCHFAWDCDGYSKDCNNCPAIAGSNSMKNLAKQNLKFKIDNLLNVDLRFVLLTKKLKEQFLLSNFKAYKSLLNYLPIDSNLFKIQEKLMARENIQVVTDKKVIFFGATDMRDERKGMLVMVEALHELKKIIFESKIDVLVLVAGGSCEEILADIPFEHKYLGNIKSQEILKNIYSASDVFVCPSMEDSGPMMISESLMCGIPVVAFKDVGIADDLIINGETGYLVTKRSAFEMADKIKKILILSKEEYSSLSKKSREMATTLFSQNTVYQTFINGIKIKKLNSFVEL